jgi:hypothetical protein
MAQLNRAPRSTQSELADAEAHQANVIAMLSASGDHDIAARLVRCQYARRNRGLGWPWRCGSSGCWQCRRTVTRSWWRGFDVWITGSAISLAIIPVHGDLLHDARRIRKGLRDIRDRKVRVHDGWQAVAFAGLVDERCAMILIQHSGINHHVIWTALARRWPDVLLVDPAQFTPTSRMTVADAAGLARRRRGVEPIRIIVPAITAAASTTKIDEPMPILLGW